MPSSARASQRSAAGDALFCQQLAAGCNFIPLSRRWPADLETPLSTWLKVGAASSHGVLLESVEGGEQLGRWSFVVSDPLWILTSRGDRSERRWRDGRLEQLSGNPFVLQQQCLAPLRSGSVEALPPVGHLFGFWGYELIRWIEPSVPVHPSAADAPPDGCWMLADTLLVFDQIKRQITAVAYADLSAGQDPEAAYSDAQARIDALEARMHEPLPAGVSPLSWHDAGPGDVDRKLQIQSNFSQSDFEAAVRTGREHIAAGDVFQLVLSQRLETRITRAPFELYRSLRMVNPSPYMA
ncbi:MAG: chorismate-binding protein, partial [Prochlorococcaceae cyanobacterium]